MEHQWTSQKGAHEYKRISFPSCVGYSMGNCEWYRTELADWIGTHGYKRWFLRSSFEYSLGRVRVFPSSDLVILFVFACSDDILTYPAGFENNWASWADVLMKCIEAYVRNWGIWLDPSQDLHWQYGHSSWRTPIRRMLTSVLCDTKDLDPIWSQSPLLDSGCSLLSVVASFIVPPLDSLPSSLSLLPLPSASFSFGSLSAISTDF